MPWLQLRIITNAGKASLIEEALLANGALSVTLEDAADQPIYEPGLGETPLWQETRVTGLFEANIDTHVVENKIREQSEPLLQCRWEILEDKDWQREWLTHFKPIQCGERFWICPSTCDKPDKDAINLILDPGLAFGTGTHPTTFMCLQWISKTLFSGKTVIDYGCGSGILGIAAILHGAKAAHGVDIDPQALLASKDNTKRNNLQSNQFSLSLPNEVNLDKADIVFANILAGPLVELAPTLIALTKYEGMICLSGVLSEQKEAVIAAYKESIRVNDVFEKDNWACIVGTKKHGQCD